MDNTLLNGRINQNKIKFLTNGDVGGFCPITHNGGTSLSYAFGRHTLNIRYNPTIQRQTLKPQEVSLRGVAKATRSNPQMEIAKLTLAMTKSFLWSNSGKGGLSVSCRFKRRSRCEFVSDVAISNWIVPDCFVAFWQARNDNVLGVFTPPILPNNTQKYNYLCKYYTCKKIN